VFLAGAAFNLALAVLIIWGSSGRRARRTTRSRRRSRREAGLRGGEGRDRARGQDPDDRGRDARDVATLIEEIDLSPDSTVSVEIERAGSRREIPSGDGRFPRGRRLPGKPGWALLPGGRPATVVQVGPGEPREAAACRRATRCSRPRAGSRSTRRSSGASSRRAPEGREPRARARGQVAHVAVTPRDEGGVGKIGVQFTPRASIATCPWAKRSSSR